MIALMIIVLGLFSYYPILAIDSFPPLVPDGEQLANSPEELQVLFKNISRRSPVWSVAYSPDGKHLASGSEDHTMRLWEVASGKELQRLEGHNRTVRSVAYSPDGKHLTSGSGYDYLYLIELLFLLDVSYFLRERERERGGKIIEWQTENGKIRRFYIGGQSGTWLSCQIIGKCLRYDNGTLVQQRDESGRFSAILPPKENGKLTLYYSTKKFGS